MGGFLCAFSPFLFRASRAAQGRFREAVAHYKDLVKLEARREWLDGLAAAYQGRARELTAKGMLKEALAIWQNRRKACPDVSPDPQYVGLLFERWYFFAEAEHPQNLYYQAVA